MEKVSVIQRKIVFLIVVSVLGHPKDLGVLTSNFLHGGDIFWNDPIQIFCGIASTNFSFPNVPWSNVKCMRKYMEMAGEMSAKIIGINTGKELSIYDKETAETIR